MILTIEAHTWPTKSGSEKGEFAMDDHRDLVALFSRPIPEENKTKLNTEDWERFCAALDAPPQDHPRMRELLARPAFWEKSH
jgi:hypothetical protein